MMKSHRVLIIALLFPILMLGILVAYKNYVLAHGKEVILPISAYDPRDLLSGHYMTYQVDYGVANICPDKNIPPQRAYICLDSKTFSYSKPLQCKLSIRGTCTYGRFLAGIERYYIPAHEAEALSKEITNKKAAILLSVMPNGYAQVKDLLIEK